MAPLGHGKKSQELLSLFKHRNPAQDQAHLALQTVEESITLTPQEWQEQIFEHNRTYYADDLAKSGKIRLLTILPGKFSKPLTCTLSSHELTKDLEYEAISYAWGGSQRLRHIWINGKPDFAVTENVFLVLRRIRHKTALRVVWVDAICINQSNARERGHQVGLMGRVYRSASTVLCWLGPCGATRPGHDEKERCHDHTLSHRDDGPETHVGVRIQCKRTHWFWAGGQYGYWWRRIWTLQEFCLGRHVLILLGAHRYTSEAFQKALTQYADWIQIGGRDWSFPEASKVVNPRLRLRESFQSQANLAFESPKGHGTTLLYALRHSDYCFSTVSKDRVYALLGLCTETPVLEPDYELPIDEVYAQAASRIFQETNNLNLLICGWNRQSLAMDRSSWVPDLSQHFQVGSGWHKLAAEDTLLLSFDWQDDLADPAAPEYSVTRTSIQITGTNVGRLECLCNGFLGRLDWTSIHSPGDYKQMPSLRCRPDHSESEFLMAKLLVLSQVVSAHLDLHHGGSHPYGKEIFSTLRRTFVADDNELKDSSNTTGNLPWEEPINEDYADRAWTNLRSCQFFVTSTGHVGVAAAFDPQLQDEIALIEGIQVPVILRPYGDNGLYSLVGAAYVQGMMKGELAGSYRRGDMKKEEFVLVGEIDPTVNIPPRERLVWHTLARINEGALNWPHWFISEEE